MTQNQVNGAAVTYAYYPTDGSASSGKIRTMKVLQSGAVVSKMVYAYEAGTGRLQSETVTAADGSSQTFTYAYRSGTDLIQSVTTSGGVTTTYGYETVDGGNQLSSVATTDTSSSPLIYADGYTTYTSGQRHTATVQRRGSAATSWNYGYDSMNQLTSAAASGGTTASYAYNFDGAGNRTDLGPVNNLDQYTNFTYDTRGNLIDDTVSTYSYDPLDRLISVTPKSPSAGSVKMTMGYDSSDRRIWKKTFAWDASLNGGAGDWSSTPQQYLKFAYDGMNLVAEFSADGTTDALLQTYAWGQDGPSGNLLSITDYSAGAVKIFTPVGDGNGNVTTLIDAASGQVAATYDYDPFGNLTNSTGPAADMNPLRFGGMRGSYTDIETGQILMGHRMYLSTQGRFAQRDPIAEAGGANLYRYAENDPIDESDPSGLSPQSSARQEEYDALANAAKLEWLKDQYGPEWAFTATPFGFSGLQVRSGTQTGRQMIFDSELTQVGYYSKNRQWQVQARPDGSVVQVGRYLDNFVDTGKGWETTLIESDVVRANRKNWAFSLSYDQANDDATRLAGTLAVGEGVEKLLDVTVRVGSGGVGVLMIDAPEAITGQSMTHVGGTLSTTDRILAGLPVGIVAAKSGKRLFTVVENAVRGGSFERAAIRNLAEDLPGVKKNWKLVSTFIDYRGQKILGVSIPDVLISKKALIEIKNADEVYLGRQILTQITYAKENKLAYRLIVAPRATVTQPLLDAVKSIGGRVEVFDRTLKQFRPYVP